MADQSLIGYQFPPFRFKVEEGKVAEFAKAIFCSDAYYFDSEAAHQQDFGAPPAPATFSTVCLHWQPAQDGNPLKLDLTRVLAGGNEWEYLRPLLAGETFTVRSHIADVTHKQGTKGPMTLIVREMVFYDEHERMALIARSTIIELPPLPPMDKAEVLPT
ncbi:N-terminal half of MaoC dehydratase [Pseudomonas sp. ok272]|uniref:FAS1-like dehydratase domain-containing protein n=1 Tax=unclassified Pseudomonas TaxID=196821 RepID=UPI0008CA9AB4|nr:MULTISPECIES: MaoC family dehydratase N-terminal domain-containing protein [unclassified Pseudomonas]SEN42920.1 N-terminal half of MaoC dehydratase [Pseudomonas sp. ok272]SFN25442.1 N-terminal half of MaoC dehydratase [Pseudomonas sp. ok602]